MAEPETDNFPRDESGALLVDEMTPAQEHQLHIDTNANMLDGAFEQENDDTKITIASTSAAQYQALYERVVINTEKRGGDPAKTMAQAIESEHRKGVITDDAHKKLVEIQKEVSEIEDPALRAEAYGKLMGEADGFLASEAEKLANAPAPDVDAATDKNKNNPFLAFMADNGVELDADSNFSLFDFFEVMMAMHDSKFSFTKMMGPLGGNKADNNAEGDSAPKQTAAQRAHLAAAENMVAPKEPDAIEKNEDPIVVAALNLIEPLSSIDSPDKEHIEESYNNFVEKIQAREALRADPNADPKELAAAENDVNHAYIELSDVIEPLSDDRTLNSDVIMSSEVQVSTAQTENELGGLNGTAGTYAVDKMPDEPIADINAAMAEGRSVVAGMFNSNATASGELIDAKTDPDAEQSPVLPIKPEITDTLIATM